MAKGRLLGDFKAGSEVIWSFRKAFLAACCRIIAEGDGKADRPGVLDAGHRREIERSKDAPCFRLGCLADCPPREIGKIEERKNQNLAYMFS